MRWWFNPVWMLALALPAVAQSNVWRGVEALSPGTEVRVQQSRSASVRGRVESVSETALILNVKTGRQMFVRQEVVRVDVKKQGHRGRNSVIGLALGAGGGLGIGAVMDAAEECRPNCFLGPDFAKAVLTPFGAAVGALVGAVLPTVDGDAFTRCPSGRKSTS